MASLASDYEPVTAQLRFDGRDLGSFANPGPAVEFHPANASRAA